MTQPAQASPLSNSPLFIDKEVIILSRNGVWLADGTEISHDPTRRLFARSLKKDEQGYFLSIGRETKRIQVEDTAYFIHRIDRSPDGTIEIWVNDETREKLEPSTLLYRPGRLACRIKGKSEEAKFLHAAYFDLLRDLKEDGTGYYLEIGSERIPLAAKSGHSG